MKRISIIIVLIFLQKVAFSQIDVPVKWSFASKKLNEQEAIIFFKVDLLKGWHIYSVNQKKGGPVKTNFIFTPSKDFKLEGHIVEPKPIKRYEIVFDIDVMYFENSVTFQQKIRLKNNQVSVKGNINFMVCNEHTCLPPNNQAFNILIK